jgi:two-component system response regulator YesN
MLFKIILSYVLVGFSYVILNKVSDNLTTEINETSSRMIDQSFNTADILLTSTYNYFSQQFIKNEMIYGAMYGKDFSPVDIYIESTVC